MGSKELEREDIPQEGCGHHPAPADKGKGPRKGGKVPIKKLSIVSFLTHISPPMF